MININQLIRNNIKNLQAYSSARDEFTGTEGIFLDANENPFGTLNRYPDPHQKALKAALAAIKNVQPNEIFLGNGSDEVIDLSFRIFCEPGKDKALTFTPTYGMYDVSAAINNIELVKIPLNAAFQINWDVVLPLKDDAAIKLIFVCSPNNPTGNNINNIEKLLQHFNAMVVVDEAYIDFSDAPSFINLIQQYPNLIVSQTFSKARGLAAARVGIAYGSSDIISYYNKVKPPYNISALNQEAALVALQNNQQTNVEIQTILNEKEKLIVALGTLPIVKKIYPSAANFILVAFDDANATYEKLVAQQVITRNRKSVVNNCIRITVGAPNENDALMKALQQLNNTQN
ncbi:histidinol-phosphate transaminase [Ferruginibacter yonginensis]|uniref:Histidinol-phosphate aminotransferase n=1 Tax=Ferruginibacter yonginensis TaxID=1310416 RepID=A0ABV8QLW1_9BACT